MEEYFHYGDWEEDDIPEQELNLDDELDDVTRVMNHSDFVDN